LRKAIFCDSANFSAMHKVLSIILLSALALVLQTTLLTSLESNKLHAEKRKITLQHADTIEGGAAAGESFRSVTGNVVFRHGNLVLKCQSATDDQRENRILLKSDLVFSDGTVELYGDTGIYEPERGVGELRGNVRGRLANNALTGKAGRAVLNRQTNQITLFDDVIVWQDGRQISGERAVLSFTNASGGDGNQKRLETIAVHGHAFFAAQEQPAAVPTVYDQFSAKTMLIRLDATSRITDITLNGQAESLYHLHDEQQQPSSINYSSGDMMRLIFKSGKLTQVTVTGNVEGKQYPTHFRGDQSINLPDFAWREKENPFR